MGRRVLVCGGRDYNDAPSMYIVLSRMHREGSIAVVIHGAAPGTDAMAGNWARKNGVDEIAVPANWAAGRAAGPIRNQQMLTDYKPDVVIAFPGGRGTADMVRRARKSNVEVVIQEGQNAEPGGG